MLNLKGGANKFVYPPFGGLQFQANRAARGLAREHIHFEMARSGLQASYAPSCQRRRVGAANLAPHSCHDRPVSCQLILERLALFLPPSPLRVACLVLAGLSLCGLGRMRTITAIIRLPRRPV